MLIEKRCGLRETVLKLISLAIVVSLANMPSQMAAGQTSAPKPQSAKTGKRSVSLDTVLSCADDPLINEVFKITKVAAQFDLSMVNMSIVRSRAVQPTSDDLNLMSKGFETTRLSETEVGFIPIDPSSGRTVKKSQLTFCHNLPIAVYDKTDLRATPEQIMVPGDDWFLEPNEVFAHADQFSFHSGVYSDSSDVFLVATKGRVHIQFVCTAKGLHLEKVYLTPKE